MLHFENRYIFKQAGNIFFSISSSYWSVFNFSMVVLTDMEFRETVPNDKKNLENVTSRDNKYKKQLSEHNNSSIPNNFAWIWEK